MCMEGDGIERTRTSLLGSPFLLAPIPPKLPCEPPWDGGRGWGTEVLTHRSAARLDGKEPAAWWVWKDNSHLLWDRDPDRAPSVPGPRLKAQDAHRAVGTMGPPPCLLQSKVTSSREGLAGAERKEVLSRRGCHIHPYNRVGDICYGWQCPAPEGAGGLFSRRLPAGASPLSLSLCAP